MECLGYSLIVDNTHTIDISMTGAVVYCILDVTMLVIICKNIGGSVFMHKSSTLIPLEALKQKTEIACGYLYH